MLLLSSCDYGMGSYHLYLVLSGLSVSTPHSWVANTDLTHQIVTYLGMLGPTS
jgi:hypothetical protein